MLTITIIGVDYEGKKKPVKQRCLCSSGAVQDLVVNAYTGARAAPSFKVDKLPPKWGIVDKPGCEPLLIPFWNASGMPMKEPEIITTARSHDTYFNDLRQPGTKASFVRLGRKTGFSISQDPKTMGKLLAEYAEDMSIRPGLIAVQWDSHLYSGRWPHQDGDACWEELATQLPDRLVWSHEHMQRTNAGKFPLDFK